MAVKTSSVSFDQPFCQFVRTWVIFTPTWVFTDCFVIVDIAIFVTDWFNSSVFDCWQGINSVSESNRYRIPMLARWWDWQEGHLERLRSCTYQSCSGWCSKHLRKCLSTSQGFFEVSFNSVEFKNFVTDWIDVKYFIVFMNIVVTTVQTSKRALKNVNMSTEVLDVVALFFVFWVKWRYTTWDTAHFTRIRLWPLLLPFVLDRRVFVAHVHTVATEAVWQFVSPKNCQVWFWRVTDVVQSVPRNGSPS